MARSDSLSTPGSLLLKRLSHEGLEVVLRRPKDSSASNEARGSSSYSWGERLVNLDMERMAGALVTQVRHGAGSKAVV